MKRILLLFSVLSLLLLCSCSVKIIPIKGSYPAQPIQMQSSKSFDEVWDKLVDLFAQKGIGIKLIDKNSGLIMLNRCVLTATCEKPEGGLYHSDASIVVPGIYYGPAGRYIPVVRKPGGAYASQRDFDTPTNVFGDWNVRVKKEGAGCLINVNITNLSYQRLYSNTRNANGLTGIDYRSTGMFEKMVGDMVK